MGEGLSTRVLGGAASGDTHQWEPRPDARDRTFLKRAWQKAKRHVSFGFRLALVHSIVPMPLLREDDENLWQRMNTQSTTPLLRC